MIKMIGAWAHAQHSMSTEQHRTCTLSLPIIYMIIIWNASRENCYTGCIEMHGIEYQTKKENDD